MAGLDTVAAEHVEICGETLADLDHDGLAKLRRDRVGFVFQSFNLFPTLTARDNIASDRLTRLHVVGICLVLGGVVVVHGGG